MPADCNPRLCFEVLAFASQWLDNGHDSAYPVCWDPDSFSFIIWNQRKTTRTSNIKVLDRIHNPGALQRTQTNSHSFFAPQENSYNQIQVSFFFHPIWATTVAIGQRKTWVPPEHWTVPKPPWDLFAPYCSQHWASPQTSLLLLLHWDWILVSARGQDQSFNVWGRKYFLFFNICYLLHLWT